MVAPAAAVAATAATKAPILPAIIGGASQLLGGIFGASSARRAERKAYERQLQQMEFMRANAREQMAFQERMRDTAYQAATKDLEKAGLNRILALGGPAASPGGAMAQVPDFGSTSATFGQQATQLGAGAIATAMDTAMRAMVSASTSAKQVAEARFSNAAATTAELPARFAGDAGEGYDKVKKSILDTLSGSTAKERESAHDQAMKDVGEFLKRQAQRVEKLQKSLDAWMELPANQKGAARYFREREKPWTPNEVR